MLLSDPIKYCQYLFTVLSVLNPIVITIIQTKKLVNRGFTLYFHKRPYDKTMSS